MSIGASQRWPRCSASWRQKQSETAHRRAPPTTSVARSQARTSGTSSDSSGSWTRARPITVSWPKTSRAKAGSPWVYAWSASAIRFFGIPSCARMSEYSKKPTTGGESR